MEQILEIDWNKCQSGREKYFLSSEALKNSVTEKILKNTFYDPLISSSEDEEKEVINWDEIFIKKETRLKNHQIFIPGFRGVPKYPKLSSLTAIQHTKLLKVICANNSHIFPQKVFPKPTTSDFILFEKLKCMYEKEQKEYQTWAKEIWTTEHCVRAFRPKPCVELVYDAYFKLRACELQCYPKEYTLAAQIPLESNHENNYQTLVYCDDLISINNLDLLQVQQETIEEKVIIVKSGDVPSPCSKHKCRFILPMEKYVSILPMIDIERKLAQYALEQGAQYIASESALKCLLNIDKTWYITVCVSEVVKSNNEISNVIVLGSEFSIKKESARQRTYKAFHYLLEDALVPLSERARLITERALASKENKLNISNIVINDDLTLSSDEEENLCIDIDDDLQECDHLTESEKNSEDRLQEGDSMKEDGSIKDMRTGGVDACRCKDTVFEVPPPRSYKKWCLRNKETSEQLDIIIHCEHRVRDNEGEIVLEPIPEYQLDCGAVSLSQHNIAALTLSLILRNNARLLTVRIDGSSGELVSMEKWGLSEWTNKHGDMFPKICDILHATLSQLQGLLPGNYILKHEPSHGPNAMLYCPGKSGTDTLSLDIDMTAPAPTEQAADFVEPPTLCDDLLPIHKHRRILPCAFTPYADQLPKVPRKPATRSKTPPQAIQWPTRLKTKKKFGD